MKNKSLFVQIISLIILAAACILLTVVIAFFAGSLNVELFDFKNLNFSNMIPIFIIGGFISCVLVGICVIFVARTAFLKAKKYLEESETKEEKGEPKK